MSIRLACEDGCLIVAAASYTLKFPADRPFAYLLEPNGETLAELFVLSGVNPLNGRDDALGFGAWQTQAGDGWVQLDLAVDSLVWDSKQVHFRCEPDRFAYWIEVSGEGELAEVNYFGGYSSAQLRFGSGFFWSGHNFQLGYNPEPNTREAAHFQPGEGATIDLMGSPLPGKSHWFFTPPPFFYGFEGQSGWVGMGIVAPAGGYRFTEYNYHTRPGAFHLSLAFEGHTRVSGSYRLPEVQFSFGKDEYAALRQHVGAVRSQLDRSSLRRATRPSWWYEPIFCGWGAQCCAASLVAGRAPDFATQAEYDRYLATLEAGGINPGILVLDDKWQATYGDNYADERKWPDLRGFIQGQHAAGRKVLLWLKFWDPEGVPAELCITNGRGDRVAIDPTHPAMQERLRDSVRRMIHPDGYGADGFKIDFSARIPSGPGQRLRGDAWGLELMRVYLELIAREAKAIKPDALMMAHTPHPYLADVIDMIRLNDINKISDINRAMAERAKVASIACPEAIIDTDNWPVYDKHAWRDYVLLQPELGVPSLYYTGFIDTSKETFEPEDYELIRKVWQEHRTRHAPAAPRTPEV